MNSNLFLANLVMGSGNNHLAHMLGNLFGAELKSVVENDKLTGLEIEKLMDGGLAQMIGLRINDVIVSLCGLPVRELSSVEVIIQICLSREANVMKVGYVSFPQTNKSTSN